MRTTQETSHRNSSIPTLRPDAVQRKCACGRSSSMDAECEECKGKQLAVQRYSAGREAPEGLVSRPAIGSSVALPDSSDNPSGLGHNFSQVRVHEPHDRSIQTKSVVEMPSDRHEQEADGIAEMVTHPPRAASTIRHESIAASRVAFAVQRAPANFSERASSSGPGLESQTITPSEQAAARSLIVDDDAREV